MNRLVVATLVFAAMACAPPARSAEPAKLLQDWAAAHANGSGDRAAQLYTPDARVWSVAAPKEWVGHDDIGHYLSVFALGASRPSFGVETYTLMKLGEGVTLATGHCTVVREQWDGSRAREECRFSLMLVQDSAGAWRIAGQHSSVMPR
jgi:uncharacterized protein (TIGR02246 family)